MKLVFSDGKEIEIFVQDYADKSIYRIMKKRAKDLAIITRYGAIRKNRKPRYDERPIDEALDSKLKSYEDWLIEKFTVEIHDKLIATKTYLKHEDKVFDYVEKYLESKNLQFKYTLGLVDRIAIELQTKASKYIKVN